MATKNLMRLVPLAIVFIGWQILADQSPRSEFLFGSPSLVIQALVQQLLSGDLIAHTAVTAAEAIVGFAIGVTIGSLVGFAMLYSPRFAVLSEPYVIALGSIPVFAVAPMMIVWFGIGFQMKVAMAFFSTIFVALSQAYRGGRSMSDEMKTLFELNNASNPRTFLKLILPSSMDWVLASLHMNIGLALLGAFIGEFIASDSGLGYAMLKAGGVYDVPSVLAAVVCMACLALGLNWIVRKVEDKRKAIIELISVPPILRHHLVRPKQVSLRIAD